jgi:hypothetical protein
MKTVLILNHRETHCGVQSFGRRVYDLANRSKQVRYLYAEIEHPHEYLAVVQEYKPDFIVYNWHRGTMPWLSEDLVGLFKSIKHYFIYHEEFTRANYDKYLFFGDYDFNGGAQFGDKKVLLPRPLLDYEGSYPENNVITIGSFGFGFWQKGYHTLTRLVNDSFDKAVLNFHMPYSHFGDPLHEQCNEVEAACRKANTNPGIALNITHDFKDNNGVLSFLAGNDINVFMYGENGEGISSVIDFALSVKRPIGISNSRMFRHISNDAILLESNSISDIISRGTSVLDKFYTNWSTQNFVEELDKEFV